MPADTRDLHRILSLCSSPTSGARTLAREKALTDEWRRTHRTEPKTLPVAVGEEKFVTTTIPRSAHDPRRAV